MKQTPARFSKSPSWVQRRGSNIWAVANRTLSARGSFSERPIMGARMARSAFKIDDASFHHQGHGPKRFVLPSLAEDSLEDFEKADRRNNS